MSFFVRLDPAEFDPSILLDGFAQPRVNLAARADSDCSLIIDYDANKQTYTYAFDPPQFVLWHPDDTIKFELVNKISTMADMRLHKHCCTDPTSPKLVAMQDHTQQILPKDFYSPTTTAARMKLTLQPYQMVHIGLIVQITPKIPGLKPKFLLCDPQVGSGPP